jgi:hypothetical protein
MSTPRRTIALSSGSLLEKVDYMPFMGFMIVKATQKKSDFKLTSEIKNAALDLAEQFNCEAVSVKEAKQDSAQTTETAAEESANELAFRTQICAQFGLNDLSSAEFWKAWDSIVTVGKIQEKVQMLQTNRTEHKEDLIEIHSDTNLRHLRKIQSAMTELKLNMNLDRGSITEPKPITFADMPFSATCIEKQDIAGVFKNMLNRILSRKQRPEEIILIYANPAKIKDADIQKRAMAKLKNIEALCKEYNEKLTKEGIKINLVLQDQPIEQMLKSLYTVAAEPERTLTLA